MTASYAVYVTAIGDAFAMNRVWNVMRSDIGDNFSIRNSGNGEEPATHLLGGCPVTPELATQFLNVAALIEADEIAPAGGWPLLDTDEETVLLTKADAIDAASRLYVNINSGPDGAVYPELNREFVASSLNLIEIPGVVDL